MWDIAFYLTLVLLLAGAMIVGAAVVRGVMKGGSPTAILFGPKPERRLDVVEHASIDGRRRLVLVRRDEVEHLIMTGGPVDVVIETGIGAGRSKARLNGEVVEGPTAVFSRGPRSVAPAAGVEP
jgi:hypothetical protein